MAEALWWQVLNHCDGREVSSPYTGISLVRNCNPLGPYSRTIPRVLRGSQGGMRFLMSEVPLWRQVLDHAAGSNSNTSQGLPRTTIGP